MSAMKKIYIPIDGLVCTTKNKHFMKIPFRLFSLAYCIAFTFSANLSFAQIKFGPKVGLNISELPNNTEYIINDIFIVLFSVYFPPILYY